MDRPPLPLTADPGRLEQMFRAHRGLIWRTFRCRGLAPDLEADATQEVFLVAAQRLTDIQVGKERAFLIGTAMHIIQNARRARSRLQLEEDLDVLDESQPAADDRKSALDLIGKILSRIDPPLAEVFALFEISEFTLIEIAELLGIPPGTAASRLRRAREAFSEAARRIELTLRREVGQP
jgi:RNA polymerase sigma-70 factor (ECF subfamily)